MEPTAPQQYSLRDHDLLVKLDTKMDHLSGEIKEIKDNSAERLNRLEDGKVDKKDFDDAMKQKNIDHENFVSKEAHKSLADKVAFHQFIIISACGLVLTAVILAGVYQLLK